MRKREIICLMLFVGIIFMSINVSAYTCEGIFTDDLVGKLDTWVYKPIKWATPILLLVLTSIDYAKEVFSGTKDGFAKANKNFLKRSIAALIIFFAPDILKTIVDFVNQSAISDCMKSHFN